MKQLLFAGLFVLLFIPSFSQVNSAYKFSTAGCNVIAYKQGTSCIASAYSFYVISDAGVQASSAFYTLANTSREVNGIGINPSDLYLYGIEYDRDGSCGFSNFHLKRYDSQGGSDDLGLLAAPAGGSVSGALGCVTNNGNFIYSTKDASGTSCISVIGGVGTLPSDPAATLSPSFSKPIVNNAGNYIYADWAIHPYNQKMYTYGIANIGGVSTGSVLELDPATGILKTVGATDTTDFLDVARDNFGGVYFGNNNYLYGVNVATRKLYKIDVITGAVTYACTMSGSGQIRADMGSYTTGWVVLPVEFEKTELIATAESNRLHWTIAAGSDIKTFSVEQNTGDGFREIKSIAATDQNQTDFNTPVQSAVAAQYRIKAIGKDGKAVYSITVQSRTNAGSIKIVANPVVNRQLQVMLNAAGKYGFSIVAANGVIVQKGAMAFTANAVQNIQLPALSSGVCLLSLEGGQCVKFVVE